MFNFWSMCKNPIICLFLIWHVLGPLKTFISACVHAHAPVCVQNKGECMREREREREREGEEGGRGNSRAVDS